MAMAEEFINDDSGDRLTPDAEKQIEATLFKQGEAYAARNARSKTENKGRADSRAAIKSLGMNPSAFAQAIKLIKDLTPSELKDWKRDFEITLKVMGARQKDLFPMEQLAAEARIKRAKEKAAGKPRTQAELDAETDANRKSDPANGGAQVDLEDAIAAQTAKELAEGAALLEGKSDAWRAGFNAVAAGGERGSNPFMEGSAETRDWLAGFEAATQRAFEAAAPKAPDGSDSETETVPAEPVIKPKKQSQSAKAAAIAAAVQGRG